MRLPYLGAAAVCDVLLPLLLLSVSRVAAASDHSTPSPLWIEPSGQWYGIDGTWSTFGFAVGSPAQIVYLTVATALSEVWVIQTGGCAPVQLCIDARGGVFDIGASKTWRALGGWQLGMNYTGMGGNADYGLETFAFVNTVTSYTTEIAGTLVGALNDTNYYEGYIGVGVTQGRFGSNLTNPLISQLAESYGLIPSHGYGYTAGAYYRNNGEGSGAVASLTLGGYDNLRFVPHDTTFSLDPVSRLPTVRLRGITAHISSTASKPTRNWTSTTHPLVAMDDSIVAVIDSSTPYLWLPTEVCERFAAALNLRWQADLGVYVFAEGAQYTRYQANTSLSFTFTLSSYQNADNFGQPLNMRGVVNITLPATAFAHLLRYPFKNVIQWGQSSIPYFPLKRSTKEVNNNQYILGRVFMQEAYIITSYDRSTFSLHQALFPNNLLSNYSLQAITRPADSPYPAFQGGPGTSHALNAGQIAGIVLSAFITGSIFGLLLWCCCRRNWKAKQQEPAGQEEENKDEPQPARKEEPQSPVKRMFTMIIRKTRSRRPPVSKTDRTDAQPAEVGADAQHQVFEMPVPPEPVELDSHDVGDEDSEFGVDSTQELSQYEITRRKLERQLQGPVPTYTPPASALPAAAHEKSMEDVSPVAHYRPPEEPSPTPSLTEANSNSLPGSPLTPHGDWTGRVFDVPPPLTISPPTHLLQVPNGSDRSCSYSPVSPRSIHSPHTFAPSTVTRSGSDVSPTTPTGSMQLPPPTLQRTPIDPSRVICLGALPGNVRLPLPQPSVPRIVTTASPSAKAGEPHIQSDDLPRAPRHNRTRTQGSSETLGSNFTVEETRLRAEELTRYQSAAQDQPEQEGDSDIPRSPRSMERIETGDELIHVPQVAEKRYSWEDPERG